MPGIKHDNEKLRMDLIPVSTLQGLAEVLTFGAGKYGDRNWEAGIKWSRVYAAAMRHLTAWWAGENLDAETKLSHLKHAACCISFLVEYEKTRLEFDDRPICRPEMANVAGRTYGDGVRSNPGNSASRLGNAADREGQS